jgi:homoserine kinase type II
MRLFGLKTEGDDLMPPINRSEIEAIISLYPVGAVKEILHAPGGMVSENWFVETVLGRFFLRCRSLDFSPESIDFELELIDRLVSCGFPTPALIHSMDGALRIEKDGRNWELYEHIPGEKFEAGNLSQIRSAGEMLALFHKATADYRVDVDGLPRRRIDLDNICTITGELEERLITGLRSKLGARIGTMTSRMAIEFLRKRVALVLKGLQPLSGLPLTITHGDFHPFNIIFMDNEAIALLDFGNAAYSYRAYDVAGAALRFSTLKQGYSAQSDISSRPDLGEMSTLICAYQAKLPLSQTEMKALPLLMQALYTFSAGFFLMNDPSPWRQVVMIAKIVIFTRWMDQSWETVSRAVEATTACSYGIKKG